MEEAKAKDKDFIMTYRQAKAEERLAIMLDNYCTFPKMIRKMEKKISYKIKSEREYMKSHSRGELGVRVQTSGTSDPTASEAIDNVMLEEAFKTGDVDGSILRGFDNAAEYEADIRILSIMRMDFELLVEIIDDLYEEDSEWMKSYLGKEKLLKEIAVDKGRTYDAMKKRVAKIKEEIREEILECLAMNCWEVA